MRIILISNESNSLYKTPVILNYIIRYLFVKHLRKRLLSILLNIFFNVKLFTKIFRRIKIKNHNACLKWINKSCENGYSEITYY